METNQNDEKHSMTSSSENRVLQSALREAKWALWIWLFAMVYTVGMCTWKGYGRPAESLAFVFGFPDWAFWGLILPWLVCVVIAWAYSFWIMTDEPLDPIAADEASSGATSRGVGDHD